MAKNDKKGTRSPLVGDPAVTIPTKLAVELAVVVDPLITLAKCEIKLFIIVTLVSG